MKNSIGTSVILTLAGESHGSMLCAILDGLAPGIPVDEQFIASRLALRRPQGPADTARREKDAFSIVSGVFEGRTTGAPITILIPNEDVRSADYERTHALARPSHADYAAAPTPWRAPRMPTTPPISNTVAAKTGAAEAISAAG